MRVFLIIWVFLFLPLWGAPIEEPEIVIELTGTPDKTVTDGINIWDKDAKTLTRLLGRKTREEALALITSVSTKDANVRASDGTKYRFVQYGREGGYRKFLFRAQEPQTLVAVATTPQEALTLCERYRVNIGLSETEFLNIYPTQATAVFVGTTGQSLYKVQEAPQPKFFLFKNKQLVRTPEPAEAEKWLKSQKQAAAVPAPKTAPAKTFKALVEGGTVTDQMYLPRVVSPFHPVPVPVTDDTSARQQTASP